MGIYASSGGSIYPPRAHVSTCSLEALGTLLAGQTGASGIWPTANVAIFIPFCLFSPVVATRLFIINGPAGSGNAEVRIYHRRGNRLVSIGSTADHGGTRRAEVD